VKPSWYGESVGHYEGDTLVVDTIGQNTKTYVDNYRTPHSEKLHVTERFHLTNEGKNLRRHHGRGYRRLQQPIKVSRPAARNGKADGRILLRESGARDSSLSTSNPSDSEQADF